MCKRRIYLFSKEKSAPKKPCLTPVFFSALFSSQSGSAHSTSPQSPLTANSTFLARGG